MHFEIRPMRTQDLDAVLRVQAACYPPSMQEAGDVVLARIAAALEHCVVGCVPDGSADALRGYLFCYPSVLGKITALDAQFEIAQRADTLYLHDLAIDPRAHGMGLARRLVAHALAQGRAAGMAHSALVSVQDSGRFWGALGYQPQAALAPDLSGYPADARYLVRAPI